MRPVGRWPARPILLGALGTLLLTAEVAAEWEPSQGGRSHDEVVRISQTITDRSVLHDDLRPLLEALPSHLTRTRQQAASTRSRLLEARRELVERLGRVHETELGEVLVDERGRYKVRVRFYEGRRGAGPKRPFRSLSYLYARCAQRWCLLWVGFWDPRTGTWNVLEG